MLQEVDRKWKVVYYHLYANDFHLIFQTNLENLLIWRDLFSEGI